MKSMIAHHALDCVALQKTEAGDARNTFSVRRDKPFSQPFQAKAPAQVIDPTENTPPSVDRD
jgi:hypothetical protein